MFCRHTIRLGVTMLYLKILILNSQTLINIIPFSKLVLQNFMTKYLIFTRIDGNLLKYQGITLLFTITKMREWWAGAFIFMHNWKVICFSFSFCGLWYIWRVSFVLSPAWFNYGNVLIISTHYINQTENHSFLCSKFDQPPLCLKIEHITVYVFSQP